MSAKKNSCLGQPGLPNGFGEKEGEKPSQSRFKIRQKKVKRRLFKYFYNDFPGPQIWSPDPKIRPWTPKLKPLGSLVTLKLNTFYPKLRTDSLMGFALNRVKLYSRTLKVDMGPLVPGGMVWLSVTHPCRISRRFQLDLMDTSRSKACLLIAYYRVLKYYCDCCRTHQAT